jgi:hypothetical protein
LAFLTFSHRKLVFYGAFVRARRALNRPFRWFSARVVIFGKHCTTVVLLGGADKATVIGGASFRLIAVGAGLLLLDVLTAAVRGAEAGKGHGTRLVNYLKAVCLLNTRMAHMAPIET